MKKDIIKNVVSGRNIGTLLFDKVFDASMIIPIENRISNKPFGGIWTSPYDLNRGSDWIQWCISEEYHEYHENDDITFIELIDESRLVFIDSYQQFIDTINKFTFKVQIVASSYIYLDFERLSCYFDGIYLTRQGLRETTSYYPPKLSKSDLYGWDCESVLIFKNESISRTYPGKIKKEWITNHKV